MLQFLWKFGETGAERPGGPAETDPLAHPALRRMTEREIADLPLRSEEVGHDPTPAPTPGPAYSASRTRTRVWAMSAKAAIKVLGSLAS